MSLSALAVLAILVVIVMVETVAVLLHEETISQALWAWLRKYPWLLFLAGFVCGHLVPWGR